jgi:hypothetical protein
VGIYPLVNQHNYGKSPFLMGKSTVSVAIFNSYVSLPEENGNIIGHRTSKICGYMWRQLEFKTKQLLYIEIWYRGEIRWSQRCVWLLIINFDAPTTIPTTAFLPLNYIDPEKHHLSEKTRIPTPSHGRVEVNLWGGIFSPVCQFQIADIHYWLYG